MNIEIETSEFFAHAVPVYVCTESLIVVPLVSYLTPPTPLLQGLRGDMVLVAGVNTGTVKVKVRLRERDDIIKL